MRDFLTFLVTILFMAWAYTISPLAAFILILAVTFVKFQDIPDPENAK